MADTPSFEHYSVKMSLNRVAFLFSGPQRLASRQVQEWTTPTEKRFSVSLSPYIACVEAERSEEDEESKRHHDINVNITPKARPGRQNGANRPAAGIKSSKTGERWEIPNLYLIC